MTIEYRGENRRPYADVKRFYVARGLSGQSDDAVRSALRERFGVTDFWATNKLSDYERLDGDSASFAIVTPFLD